MQHHDLRILYTFLEKEKREDKLANYNEYCMIRYLIKKSDATATFFTSEPFEPEVTLIPKLKVSKLDYPLLNETGKDLWNEQ